MAIMSNQTRKVPDLPTLVNVTDGDVVLVHSGAGLKKVPVSTLKRTFATPQEYFTSDLKLKRYGSTR